MSKIDGTAVSPQILEELAGTPFACSSLEQLHGGTANYTFQGNLIQPLPDGTEKIMIKHSKPYSASDNSFALEINRSFTEEKCLELASSLPPARSERVVVRTPKLFHFNPDTNTQVQEYLENAIDLKRWALDHNSPAFQEQEAHFHAVGNTIGVWLKTLHSWGMEPEQAELREQAKGNTAMQLLKNRINYDYLVRGVARFPEILTEVKETFEAVKAMSEAELKDETQLFLIHGDFWTGNTLIPNVPFQDGVQTPVFIVDWEMCELGVRPLDLGQLIAELYNLVLYKDITAIKWLINGFAEGYGYVDDAFAYRVAIHTGAHLATISSFVPWGGTDEQVRMVVQTGRDLIVHAWHKDREWFEASDLACLFRRG